MNMDDELFWKLLQPVHPSAASFCLKLAGNREDGEDLYQDALLTAMRRFETLKDQSAFRPWLFRIIVNRHKNRCRSQWWRRHLPLTAEIAESAGYDDPSQKYESRRKLAELLICLPVEDRAMIVLREIEGWTTAELASMFNKPEGTIKTRLFRARAKMRKALERRLRPGKTNSSSLEVAYAVQRCPAVDE